MILKVSCSSRTDEPEFVEWGYGGMGSVKNTAGQSAIWARVQASNEASGLAKSNVDEDDGTGMAWVKRRKEQRERERKEREKAEAEVRAKVGAEEGAIESPSADATESGETGELAVSSAEAATPTSETQESTPVVPVSEPTPPTPSTATPLASDASKPFAYPEHITRAVSIPAPSPHHRHHHSHHGHHHSASSIHFERRESADTARNVPVVSPTVDDSAVPSDHLQPVARAPSEAGTEMESVGSSAASTSSDDEDSEGSPKDAEGGFGLDDDDDEEEEVSIRCRCGYMLDG